MHQAYNYQLHRKLEKEHESQRRYAFPNKSRSELLSQAPVDLTPLNSSKFIWNNKDLDKFEDEWSLKPVSLRGIFDHTKEIQVEKWQDGEKGVEVITPFFTHLNEKGEECGVLVNRGWVPEDLKD